MAKKLWSVFTNDMNKCVITGSTQVARHHIFGSYNRHNSEVRGFVIPLRYDYHNMTPYSIHVDYNLALYWRKECQKYYEEHYGTREDFIKEFGRSYL